MYKLLFRPLLFLLNPEKAHRFTFSVIGFFLKLPLAGALLSSVYKVRSEKLQRNLFGLNFPNPLGLAAGFDKNAEHCDELSALGFGFVEIGTVTPLPQPGNPPPRLFRLPADQALINRMGFNSDGMEQVLANLKRRKNSLIIGGNIGKNKVTDNELAYEDYIKCFNYLFDYVDYFAVNVSSPNTPGLRQLQDEKYLVKILGSLQIENRKKSKPKPILLKIAPDLSFEEIDRILEVVRKTEIDGLIACNTSISRQNLQTTQESLEEIGAGGLSGKPIGQKSTEIIRYINQKTGSRLPIIGVGGIHSVDDALEKLEAGASLIQLYTGFIYEGPQLIRDINKAIVRS